MLEIVSAAAAVGLDEIAITDHCDISQQPIKKLYDGDKVFNEWKEASSRSSVPVCYGIELGDVLFDTAKAQTVLDSYAFDFVLGSIHILTDKTDFYCCEYTSERQCNELLLQYVEELLLFVKWGKFNVLAHLCYPLRYMRYLAGINVGLEPYQDALIPIFKLMSQQGIGLELNMAGINRGWGVEYSEHKYLKLFKECGGEIVTVGSDSHSLNNVGKNIKMGNDMIIDAGFEHICTFKERKPCFEKIV